MGTDHSWFIFSCRQRGTELNPNARLKAAESRMLTFSRVHDSPANKGLSSAFLAALERRQELLENLRCFFFLLDSHAEKCVFTGGLCVCHFINPNGPLLSLPFS